MLGGDDGGTMLRNDDEGRRSLMGDDNGGTMMKGYDSAAGAYPLVARPFVLSKIN